MNQDKTLSTLQKNLETTAQRLSIIEEQHRLCASMLARQICEEERSLPTLFEQFCSLGKEPQETEKAIFCRTYAAIHAKDPALRPEKLFSMNDVPPAGSHGKIAFVRNRQNERAYEHFSRVVIGAKPVLVSDFSEACDLVYSGRCSYCILPVENSSGGRLGSFYAMMDRYELKICAIFELENEETSESVRYALAGRSLPRPIVPSQSCALEISLTREDGSRISELLRATAILGATPSRIDFLPLEYDHSFYRLFLTFCIKALDAPSLGLYLSLCYPNYTPIGFYAVSL